MAIWNYTVTWNFLQTIGMMNSNYNIYVQLQLYRFLKPLGNGCNCKRHATIWFVWVLPLHHFDAVNDRTDTEAEGTACACVLYFRQMCFRVKHNSLVARIVACHVAFSYIRNEKVTSSYKAISCKATGNDHSASTATDERWGMMYRMSILGEKLTAVNAHFRINDGDHLLFVIEVVISAYGGQGRADYLSDLQN